jgi:HSP20 family protein
MVVKFERVPMMRAAWENVSEFESGIDSLFNGFVGRAASRTNVPSIDFLEGSNESTLVMEIPGVSKEEVKLSLEGDMLSVKGECKGAGLPEGGRWIRNERSHGSFVRTVQLPHPVKADAVTAELVNGLLRVTLPKAEEARPREIGIH